jgi:hypothetical protein
MTPKLHFPCTGLACHLLHIDSAQKRTHTSRGPMFESWAVREAVKHRWNEGLDSGLHFWGDNHGTEVDLMFEHAGPLHETSPISPALHPDPNLYMRRRAADHPQVHGRSPPSRCR